MERDEVGVPRNNLNPFNYGANENENDKEKEKFSTANRGSWGENGKRLRPFFPSFASKSIGRPGQMQISYTLLYQAKQFA